MTNAESPAGWYSDPTGHGDARDWNGAAWTQSVSRGGVAADAAIDPSQAQIPPAPGTQVAPPSTPTPAPAPPQTVNVSSKSSPLGVIFGALAVLLIVVLVVFLVSNDDSSDDTPTPGTDAPAEQPADEPPPEEGS